MANLVGQDPLSPQTNTLLDRPALWHLCRADSPPVTAVVTARNGQVVVQVSYGPIAQQRVVCATMLEAMERAERLRTRLEAYGYRRARRDRRRAAAARCA